MSSYSPIVDSQNQRFSYIKRSAICESFITKLLGCLGPIIIPPLHIYVIYNLWQQYAHRVDKKFCSCSCWDTVFKGTYESGVASYKHVYFNATFNTAKIWVLTTVCVISLYEGVRRMASLMLRHRLRISMLVLFLSSIFSHYYSWWSFFNYWNDEFYAQWYHQLIFSVSELLSTFFVLKLADTQTAVRSFEALFIIIVSLIHIIASSCDQFLVNVLFGEGSSHQVVRDLGLMVSDVLHLLVPLLELYCVCPIKRQLYRGCLLLSMLVTAGLVLSLYITKRAATMPI